MKKNKEIVLKNKNKINENLMNYWDGIEHINKLLNYVEKHDMKKPNIVKGLEFSKFILETNFDIISDFYKLFSELENFTYIKKDTKTLKKEVSEIKYPKFDKNGTIVLKTGKLDLNTLEKLY